MKIRNKKFNIAIVLAVVLFVGAIISVIHIKPKVADAYENYNVNYDIGYSPNTNGTSKSRSNILGTIQIEGLGCHDADPNCGYGLEDGYSSTYLTHGCK